MSLDSGTRLDRYEIASPIGAGGMGEVYRARDTKLGRDVAIKVLPDELAGDRDRLKRFEREARLLAQLNHACIATLHGLEEHDGQPFLVMELVEGETLAERVAAGSFSLAEAVDLFVGIAEGLEAAHEKGVVHRDLKPANIKITPDGKPKILDFGLAKALMAEQNVSAETSQSPTLTKGTALGAIMGTAGYMSPEQARGKTVDKRTDVWAFGCCLYEALTARKAFDGETTTDILTAVIHREPDWTRLPGTTPANVRRLLRRCFQKDPRMRLHDMADARLELQDERFEAAPVGPSKRTPLLAMAFVTALALGAALWSLSRESLPHESPVARFALPLLDDRALFVSVNGSAIALSPDGQHIAWSTGRSGTGPLLMRSMGELEPMVLEGTEGGSAPFFSPDGRWLGFLARRRVWKVPVSGGAPVEIREFAGTPRGASWGEDGTILLSLPDGLHRFSSEGGETETIARPDRAKRDKSLRFPDWLPGGRAVIFTTGTADMETWDEASIVVLSLETGDIDTLVTGGTHARYSSTGHIVYARGQRLFAVPFDASTLEVTGDSVELLDGLSTLPSDGPAQFALSKNGTLVYAPGTALLSKGRAYIVSQRGEVEPLVEMPRSARRLRISPDGTRVAFELRGANHSIWTYDMARRVLTPILTGFNNFDPQWSPDGTQLVFASDAENFFDLYRVAADGSGERERLLPTAGTGRLPQSWSPDGRFLLYTEESTSERTERDLMVLSLDGDRETRVFLQTQASESSGRISPDGGWVAHASDESGRSEIYLRSFEDPGPKWQISTDGGTLPRWNPRGGELFYLEGDKVMSVDVDVSTNPGEPELGRPRLLFQTSLRTVGGADYDVMPDGQSFITIADVEGDPNPKELVVVQNFAEELKRLVRADQ